MRRYTYMRCGVLAGRAEGKLNYTQLEGAWRHQDDPELVILLCPSCKSDLLPISRDAEGRLEVWTEEEVKERDVG